MLKRYTLGQNEIKTIVLDMSGEYEVSLEGEGAEATIVGGWELSNNDSLTVMLTIRHKSEHTRADTLLKAVLKDAAHATIRGKIIVEKGAQHTESFLREAVLLTSPKAQATAIPDLEIEANEVKCSHAATVATIDEEQLYYLTSRGIGRQEATTLITEGFLQTIRDTIQAHVGAA